MSPRNALQEALERADQNLRDLERAHFRDDHHALPTLGDFRVLVQAARRWDAFSLQFTHGDEVENAVLALEMNTLEELADKLIAAASPSPTGAPRA